MPWLLAVRRWHAGIQLMQTICCRRLPGVPVCLHVSTTSPCGCWPTVCSKTDLLWCVTACCCHQRPRQLLESVRLCQPVEVGLRSRNLLWLWFQHAMPRSDNRCQLLCCSASAAQHSTFVADVWLPDACRRSRPVPSGLRQCWAGRLTRLRVQLSPVGTQRCCMIYRRLVAFGPHHRHTHQFSLAESTRGCTVQAGDDRLSLAERHGSIIPGCRPATFVQHAIQTTSAVLTDTPAGCSPVAVRNCRWPSLRLRWCSAVEQLATGHCRVQHTFTVPP